MGAYMDFLKIIAKLGLKELAKVGKSGNGTGKLEFLGDFANLLKNEPKKIKDTIENLKAKAPSAPTIKDILKKIDGTKKVVKKEISTKTNEITKKPKSSILVFLMKKLFGLMLLG
ncbi:Hypothetical protein SRAE_X000140300 [Strongyloides ratti]|uniref:Variable large protein n=1 Tax=Strongyloides ratti TaxID=34506 RepID=A0A090KWP1_STRRB|nr:Hypothetical protein SRAE_X000140300 [Strongyloides ratti]CEF59657.1 Hypothetical protein SRAE_X000140300 [Strongyloides ratti]